MKKYIVGVVLAMSATAVYAACKTHTYITNGKYVTCTTCCYSPNNCTTTCY